MDVDVEHPPHHHSPTGHYWLDRLLPLSALLISIVSIAIALHHGKVMEALVHQNERLVQANSLPHLEIFGSNAAVDGAPHTTFLVANRGIGPAEIRSVQILVRGRPVRDLVELLAACCDAGPAEGPSTSTLLGTMIQPGQEVRYIDFPMTVALKATAERLNAARVSDEIETRLCYCSVFDECWIRSSTGRSRPRPVKVCPMPKPQYAL